MVQIDNMEMPKNCFDCDLNYDCYRCVITGTRYFEDEQFDPSEERLSDCPLREVQPVRHGRWIRHTEQKNIFNGKTIECSECGEKYVVQYIEDEKYCRSCGARMDGKNDGS